MAELDRRAIKALASDTRVAILKSLGVRRKMPSELAREQELAASTIIEHLSVLEGANLIRKVRTGHKWIYYELTRKGQELVAPRLPMQHIIVLGLGLLLVFGGLNFVQMAVPPLYGQPATVTSEQNAGAAAVPDKLAIPTEAPVPIRAPDLVPPAVSVLVLGTALALYGGWRVWRAVD
jgi:DNA-binding transcriptional ArsR family regulator